jgi:hypothetical protein
LTREQIIDVMREELLRQQRERKVSLVSVEKPDTFQVIGVIDIYALAEAVMRCS